MGSARHNARYLPDARFPPDLHVEPDLGLALRGTRDAIIVVPSHAFRGVLGQVAQRIDPDCGIAWATKGFELSTGLLPHQVAGEVLGARRKLAVLSGPTFAKEVGAGLPTAMTIASLDEAFALRLAEDIASEKFRAYTSTDIIGVETGGAVKNVLAVGAGLSDGLGFGANTRIALITRGLAEMMRLGVALGARSETFMGLAGLGDLVLTCTDDQSRNRRFGLLLAGGATADEALGRIGQVVEGYPAARAVYAVAQRKGVSMPIVAGIHRTLYDGVPAAEVVRELMTRPVRAEVDSE
ncbi:MAG: Glycerol-3-phosphate dehydrogenase [NAD(P)+] [Steroidobacteraceae bacterium]|nr:Glycerol-3-phosphate dehydrogenase [NAD(P)+] [Steroidobacteraceae bacterium]